MTLPEYIRMAALITGTLNEITSFHPMQDHEFLTEDRLVERSRFMSDLGPVTVVVNRSEYHYTYGDHELPPCGLIIEAPLFVAAYVTRFEGVELARPTLFALKALDGKALRESGEILVYQGDPEDPTDVPLMGEMIVVGQERIIKR